jgi:phenylacetate-CoA ligase
MFSPEVETRPPAAQLEIDAARYRRQIEYLFERSPFYRKKLQQAGFANALDVGELRDVHRLPFTEKDEIRRTQAEHPPFGEHLACDPQDLVRIYSTSGTTGLPCFIGLTRADLDMFATNVARGYTAAGFSPRQRLVISANAGPFVAGAAYHGFDKIGCTVIPVGTGNTERLVTAIRRLGATGISATPSYGLYLLDWCSQRGIDTRTLGLTNMITAGEPGGGDPMIRARLEGAFGCRVREVMGTADVSLTVWAEDADAQGMHFMARDFVHVELIEPGSGNPIAWEDGAQGELVYTALQREAMPLLRFRSRDHVVVTMRDNPTGRTGPRIRCIGRTDDMLIVRGVNLFPSAIRSVFEDFSPYIGEVFRIRLKEHGVTQQPPLCLAVELAQGVSAPPDGLAERIATEVRARLLVSVTVELLPYGGLPRGEYKTGLVEYPT